jgi:hypothetical protein
MTTPRQDVGPQSMPKRRYGRRFRFQFGLRGLLLVTAVLALLLGFEAKRANDQRTLMREVMNLSGSICWRSRTRGLRDSVYIYLLFGFGHGRRIEEVHVGGLIAAGAAEVESQDRSHAAVTNTEKLREILSLRAMASVRHLTLYGSAVSDELIDDLAVLSHLESVQFEMTTVTASGAHRLRKWLPECEVRYGRNNGPQYTTWAPGELHPLAEAFKDPDVLVRIETVRNMSRLGGARALDLLLLATKDVDAIVRVFAVQELGNIHDDPRAVKALKAAAKDKDPAVSQRAKQSLEMQRLSKQHSAAISGVDAGLP